MSVRWPTSAATARAATWTAALTVTARMDLLQDPCRPVRTLMSVRSWVISVPSAATTWRALSAASVPTATRSPPTAATARTSTSAPRPPTTAGSCAKTSLGPSCAFVPMATNR
ncbi:hypothetical protein GWK47_041471 [Chionoecetes opilio]|uniref:Uncharacterized protein n=1 Tax=Chionoecetes opilio TaxID=41210 RepID=A0A8J4YNZ3_CHIOP|nr:hypothetical protein GWK47_041471 [Chionoecetes opilio]